MSETPAPDPKFARYIKTMPCVACLSVWWIDSGRALPLCRDHAQEFDRNPVKFAERYKLDIPALILMFRSFYERKKAA